VVDYDPELVKALEEVFDAQLAGPVTLRYFRDYRAECAHCEDVEQILSLVSMASKGRVRVEKHGADNPKAKLYRVDMFPAVIVHGREEYNVRFFGTPVGNEFTAFVKVIVAASQGVPEEVLRGDVTRAIRKVVTRPTRIMVFVTPDCPYCPYAVSAAHKLAMLCRNVYGDMVEALEFPELADKYGVQSVPHTVITVDGEEKLSFTGVTANADYLFLVKLFEAHGIELENNR